MSVQIAVRLPEPDLEALDALVDAGIFHTRADAVRAAIEGLVRAELDRAVGDAIVAGYRRVPPTPAEDEWARTSLRELIAEEPW